MPTPGARVSSWRPLEYRTTVRRSPARVSAGRGGDHLAQPARETEEASTVGEVTFEALFVLWRPTRSGGSGGLGRRETVSGDRLTAVRVGTSHTTAGVHRPLPADGTGADRADPARCHHDTGRVRTISCIRSDHRRCPRQTCTRERRRRERLGADARPCPARRMRRPRRSSSRDAARGRGHRSNHP